LLVWQGGFGAGSRLLQAAQAVGQKPQMMAFEGGQQAVL
jgi:hypothetical protein